MVSNQQVGMHPVLNMVFSRLQVDMVVLIVQNVIQMIRIRKSPTIASLVTRKTTIQQLNRIISKPGFQLHVPNAIRPVRDGIRQISNNTMTSISRFIQEITKENGTDVPIVIRQIPMLHLVAPIAMNIPNR